LSSGFKITFTIKKNMMTHKAFSSQNILKNVAILMLATLLFASCKKDNDLLPPPTEQTASAEGLYTGKYGFGNDVPDTDQKYRIKAGGVFQEIGLSSGTVVGQGTWTMNGNTLTANYTITFAPFTKYSIVATFNAASGKLVGTWGGEHDPADGGKIDMTRQ